MQVSIAMRWLGKDRSGDTPQDAVQSLTDEAAFRRDLEREIPWLLRLTRALTGDRADGHDLAQDVLIRALEHHRERRPGAPPQAGLRAIARNHWKNELNTRTVRGAGDPADTETLTDDDKVGQMEARADLADIEEGFAQLTPEFVEIITLIDVQGLSRREAAEELGLPIGTVNSRIGRAREAAREAKKEVWARRRRERGE
jgi:RNA polymerase sigma-70 factor (ECF subfamily)